MDMTTMRRTSLRRASLNMRMRMGRGEGVKEHNCKKGDAFWRHNFYMTTKSVKRTESKEDTTLAAMCQVGGNTDYNKSIPMTNGGISM
jgi:hypothetical protein